VEEDLCPNYGFTGLPLLLEVLSSHSFIEEKLLNKNYYEYYLLVDVNCG
jgi:hypothetical protein